jgi:flagellar hook assembly protein FlgD
MQNYPNPFNPKTAISYQLTANSRISLKIYDILGREIKTLINEIKTAGFYSVEWDGKNSIGQSVGSGVYFYQLKSGNGSVSTKKMVLLN